jgi:hypothetical protein
VEEDIQELKAKAKLKEQQLKEQDNFPQKNSSLSGSIEKYVVSYINNTNNYSV